MYCIFHLGEPDSYIGKDMQDMDYNTVRIYAIYIFFLPSSLQQITRTHVSPSTGVWYTWYTWCSSSLDGMGMDVLVWFRPVLSTHGWPTGCRLRLNKEDVHVQKQWGFINTASGSSYETQSQTVWVYESYSDAYFPWAAVHAGFMRQLHYC